MSHHFTLTEWKNSLATNQACCKMSSEKVISPNHAMLSANHVPAAANQFGCQSALIIITISDKRTLPLGQAHFV